jgi:peptidoglycan/LPS O-acetylase OafA/YrhL
MSAVPRRLLLFAGIFMVGTAGLLNIMFANTVSYRIAFFIVPGGFALMLPWLDTIRTFPALFAWVETIVQKLSLWSYSIYLSHIPILFTVYALLDPWRGHWAMNVLSKVAGLAVTLAVSRMLFVYFERPLTSLRPREVPVSEAPRPVSTGPSLLG